MKPKFVALVVLLLAVAPAGGAQVNAATTSTSTFGSGGLTVTPAIAEVTLNPTGETLTHIAVRNDRATAVTVGIFPDLISVDESVDPTDQDRYSAKDWLKADKEIKLKPNQTVDVVIHITPPPTASAGGHFAQVTFIPDDATANQPGQVSQSQLQGIGVQLLMTVPGEVHDELSTPTLKVTKTTKDKIEFSYSITNSGNVHDNLQLTPSLYLSGKPVTTDISGRRVAVIFPGTTRSFSYTLTKPKAGFYQIRFRTDWGTDKSNSATPVNFLVKGKPTKFIFWIVTPAWMLLVFIVLAIRRYRNT